MTEQPATPAYPVRLEIDYPEQQSRWKALLRIFLVIPLLIFVYVLNNSIELAIIAAILVRGRIPRWLFEFQVAFNRWSLRFVSYAFLLTDEYPPFEGDYSVRYEVDYPERLSRWRLVIWKIVTATPQLIVLAVLVLTLLVVVPIGWFAILIVGRFPRGLHQYVAGVLRWGARVSAYLYSLTDEFPPFSLSPEAGPGGRDSYVISSVVGSIVVVLAIAGVIAAITVAAILERAEERLEFDYEDLVTGQDVDTQIEVDSISVTLPGVNDPADFLLEPFLFPQRRHRLVEFLVIIENDGNFDLEVEESDFELEDDEGDEYDPVVILAAGGTPPVEIPEDEGLPFRLIYELPTRVDPAELRYNPGRFTAETVVYEFE